MVYVIYDQFHWLNKDHLVCMVRGRSAALERYLWYKELYPDQSFGFLDLESYNKLLRSYDRKK